MEKVSSALLASVRKPPEKKESSRWSSVTDFYPRMLQMKELETLAHTQEVELRQCFLLTYQPHVAVSHQDGNVWDLCNYGCQFSLFSSKY